MIDGIYYPNRQAECKQTDGLDLNLKNFRKKQRACNGTCYDVDAENIDILKNTKLRAHKKVFHSLEDFKFMMIYLSVNIPVTAQAPLKIER